MIEPDKPRILAIDLGTTTGWCALDPYGPRGGSKSFKPSRFESSSMRFTMFRAWLGKIIDDLDIRLVVFEQVNPAVHRGGTASHVYGGFLEALQDVCNGRKVAYHSVPIATIKKTATGRGNADKKAMVATCVSRLGVTPKDDNEADARWIIYHAINAENLGEQFK